MSLISSFNLTCDIYRLALGDEYPPTETWAMLADDVPCVRTFSTRRVVLADGSTQLLSSESVMMEPRDVTEADRLLITGTVYKIDAVVDVADLGRECRLSVARLPDGTAAEMGI